MGGIAETFNQFWNNPQGEKSVTDWFLFVGLLLLIIFAWSRILKFISDNT